MKDVESKINDLIYYADEAFLDEEKEDELFFKIRHTLNEIKNSVNDTYNIIDIWYQDGCEFPFEIDMNIDGEVKRLTFDNIREMLFTIRLLK